MVFPVSKGRPVNLNGRVYGNAIALEDTSGQRSWRRCPGRSGRGVDHGVSATHTPSRQEDELGTGHVGATIIRRLGELFTARKAECSALRETKVEYAMRPGIGRRYDGPEQRTRNFSDSEDDGWGTWRRSDRACWMVIGACDPMSRPSVDLQVRLPVTSACRVTTVFSSSSTVLSTAPHHNPKTNRKKGEPSSAPYRHGLSPTGCFPLQLKFASLKNGGRKEKKSVLPYPSIDSRYGDAFRLLLYF